MTDSIRRVGEVDLVRVTGVPRSTRADWARKGFVAAPQDKRFDEGQAVEVALFGDLLTALEPAVARAAWLDAVERVLAVAMEGSPGGHGRLDLLVNTATAAIEMVASNEEIGRIVGASSGQPYVRVPISQRVNDVREAYWRYARADRSLKGRKSKPAARERERRSR